MNSDFCMCDHLSTITQSILSLLLKKHRVRTFPEPSQWLAPPPNGRCDSAKSAACKAAAEVRKLAGLPEQAFYTHNG